ncbi:MAG TPA: extracellular solute-binding protein [Limnochordia bacterium]|nr:extracellular solute-binding protein [Limnochordia bacterium]
MQTASVNARSTGLGSATAGCLTLLAGIGLTAAAVQADPIKLTFSGWGNNGVIKPIIARFNQDHPDIQIENAQGDSTKVLAQFAAGSPPDVYRVSWAEVGSFIHQGLAMNLDPLINRDRAEFDLADFWPPALQAFQWQGHQWAMPHLIGGNLIWLNLDLLSQDGVAPPGPNWTYANDFQPMAQKLTRDAGGDGVVDEWGFGNPNHWAFWMGLTYSDGGSTFNADQTQFAVDSPASVAAIEYIRQLVDVLHASPGPADRVGDLKLWQSGKAAMSLAPAVIPTWGNVPFHYQVVPNPMGSVRRVMMGGPQPLLIAPGIPQSHVEAAWTFLKWINQPDIEAWISNTVKQFPPTRRSSVAFVDDPNIRVFGGQMENQVLFTTLMYNQITASFHKHLDEVLNGKLAPAAAAAQIESELNAQLSDEMAKWHNHKVG